MTNGGTVDSTEAGRLIDAVNGYASRSSRRDGRAEIRRRLAEAPDTFEPEAAARLRSFLGGADGAASEKTWRLRSDHQVWIEGRGFDTNPDLLWRPTGTPTFTGTNPRNPYVLPKLVKEIYERSI